MCGGNGGAAGGAGVDGCISLAGTVLPLFRTPNFASEAFRL
jgi:hypothetical protein